MDDAEVVFESHDSFESAKPLLDEVEKRLAKGLQFTNVMWLKYQEDTKENTTLLHALLELLICKGLIHLHELEERKKEVVKSLQEKCEEEPKVYLVETPDKYAHDGQVAVDCESRYPICKGVCCKLWFALSVQDLDEGVLHWNYARPFGIAQGCDGFCMHQDRVSYKCAIYENRPLICRTYSCRDDGRIWADYKSKILSPKLNPCSGCTQA